MHPSVYPFLCLSICSLTLSFVCLLIRLLNQWFISALVPSLVHGPGNTSRNTGYIQLLSLCDILVLLDHAKLQLYPANKL